MSTVTHLIRAQRAVEGEGFVVRRPFPTASLSYIDPFLLFDHMGPMEFGPGQGVGTAWHPHRGFETVTYVLDGHLEHRDSLGNQGYLHPGDTQWMTAASGVLHREGPSAAAQRTGGRMHGLQARLKALQDAAQRALASSHAPWASAASPLAPQLQSGHERTPPGAEHHIEGSNGGSNLSLPGRSTRDAGSFSHDWAGCRDRWKPQEGAKQPLTTQQETSSKSATMNPLFDSEPDSLCPQGRLRRRPGTPADPPMSLCSSQDLLLGQGYEGRNPR